jgi:mRNA interferase HigB
MNVITKRTVVFFTEQYPSAKTGLLTWLKEFSEKNFDNPNMLKETYRNASIIANHRVIFNIKGNDFRLITSVNYRTQAAYVIWFGTHKEYDDIDAATIKHVSI